MTEPIKKRHPAVAGLLSFLVLGLGQLYNGEPRRAALLYAIQASTLLLLVFAPLLSYSTPGLAIGALVVFIGLGAWIYAMVDAILGARRIGRLALRRYNRWYVYVAVALGTITVQALVETPLTAFSIPSGAMKPTLLVGDHLYADMEAYRERSPERGDVVLFRKPSEPNVIYIKRLVGLPGERIQVRGGVLHIDSAPVRREWIGDREVPGFRGFKARATAYRETLPNGRQYLIWELGDTYPYDNTPQFSVPENHYFVMGDNRDSSQDSRVMRDVGHVPAENILGRAEIVFFSHNGSARWWQLWRWPTAIRFDRLGAEIE